MDESTATVTAALLCSEDACDSQARELCFLLCSFITRKKGFIEKALSHER